MTDEGPVQNAPTPPARRRGVRVAGVVTLTLVLLVLFRRGVLVAVLTVFPLNPELGEPQQEHAATVWFDDYFTVEQLDDRTFAIAEPRYWQANYNYLIIGTERAVLFDSGPGERDILPVVESLTDLPVVVVASHLHYDHVGNHARFSEAAMLDLPSMRNLVQDGIFTPGSFQHLGAAERKDAPSFTVTEWWAPGTTIDLGGRELEVMNTPGHTPESLSLYDPNTKMIFVGDYLYPGPLFAWVPGSSLDEYLSTTEQLVTRLPQDVAILCAHRSAPPGVPMLRHRDLVALRDTLQAIEAGDANGEGFLLRRYHVNETLSIEVDLPGVPSVF